MQIMEYRMATEDLWDQSGYNLELMLNSHDAHMLAGASVRVMSPLCFLNSKVLFRFLRAQPYHKSKEFLPVAVHVNYHSDKGYKMVLVADEYLKNISGSLDKCEGDGCRIGLDSAGQLESHHRHSINDGMVTSSNFFLSRKEAAQHGCKPRSPWGGAIEGLSHELMRVGGAGPEWALKCPAGAGGDVSALCAAAKAALGDGRDLALTVADSSHRELLSVFLESAKAAGVANVLVVALDAAAAAAASAASPGVAVFQPSADPPAYFRCGRTCGICCRTSSASRSSQILRREAVTTCYACARLVCPKRSLPERASCRQRICTCHCASTGLRQAASLSAPLRSSGPSRGRFFPWVRAPSPSPVLSLSSLPSASPCSPDIFALLHPRDCPLPGVDLFLLDPDSVLLKNPFDFLYRDSDVEAMCDGWDEQTAWGYDHVIDDPTMGWSRYCHGSRIATKDTGFAFLQATSETVTLASRMARRLAAHSDQKALQLSSNVSSSSSLEKQIFNGELFFPSHGSYAQVGASIRSMNFFCFPNSKGLLRYMRKFPDLQCANPNE